MSVTPAMIAVALGVAAPAADSSQEQQWQMWIDDALMVIEARRLELGAAELDPARVDYVARQAVVVRAERPAGGATQESITVDDATRSATYPRSRRVDVEISDEWWSLLGLTPSGGQAFGVDTASSSSSAHLPWCALYFGGAYCSCGVDIAGYPIYETGPTP